MASPLVSTRHERETADLAAASPSPFAGLEALKLVASFGIVLFHQQIAGQATGYAGLPAFTLLTAALAVRSARGRDWAMYRRNRLRRLLLPWLAWSAFYALVQCALHGYAGLPIVGWLQPSMLATGAYPHLWYLPFAACSALVAGRFGGCGPTWAWLAAGALALPLASHGMSLPLPVPLPQWLFVAPAAVLGVGLARAPLGGGNDRALGGFALAAGAGCALAAFLRCDALLWQYALAAPAAAVAWAVPLRAPRLLAGLGAATFGVYVLHPFVGMMLALAAIHGGVPFTDATLVGAIWTGALALTVLLRRTPLRALL
jgi:fucose 4-O-acetylase-like acetyltransferase